MSIPQIITFVISVLNMARSTTVNQKQRLRMMYEVCEDKIRSRRFGNPSRSSYRSIFLLE
ncbi:hypothetical protein DL98DRAFT_522994 [Cadophora sp. DSE1049]|nr:hypothetical protein DL98DRAFT_522994 [Cadophora sp. DSE1049]